LHPAAGTTFDIRIISLRVLAVIPIIGLLLFRLNIHGGLLLDDNRWW
jgi:hypothetical protein